MYLHPANPHATIASLSPATGPTLHRHSSPLHVFFWKKMPETSSPKVQSQSSDWIRHIQKELANLTERSEGISIWKVPTELHQVDEDAYSPRTVSIGPFHSSNTMRSVHTQTSIRKDHDYMLSLLQQLVKKHDNLLAMEKNKWWYMLYLLNRTKDSVITLDQCGEKILDREIYVRGSYAEYIELESHALAQVMLVDGCFILELFLGSWFNNSRSGDPIIQNDRVVSNLRHDLALLENQIPFFILEDLFKIVKPHIVEKTRRAPDSITELALSFFFPVLKLNQEATSNKCRQLVHKRHSHLLDLLHNFYLSSYPKSDQECKQSFHVREQDEVQVRLLSGSTREHHEADGRESQAQHPIGEESGGFTKCANDLLGAGIEFKKEEEEAYLLEIHFDDTKGDIIIPPLRIDETTRSLLRNLIAFEQCRGKKQQPISRYAIYLGSLILSSSDLELLQKQGIITYDMKEVEDVLTFFKTISRDVVPMGSDFGKLRKQVNDYACKKSMCRLAAILKFWCQLSMETLKRDYFPTPWSFIAFLAASLLLILTALQTYYASRS